MDDGYVIFQENPGIFLTQNKIFTQPIFLLEYLRRTPPNLVCYVGFAVAGQLPPGSRCYVTRPLRRSAQLSRIRRPATTAITATTATIVVSRAARPTPRLYILRRYSELEDEKSLLLVLYYVRMTG